MACLSLPASPCNWPCLSHSPRVPRASHRPWGRCPHRRGRDFRRPCASEVGAARPADRPWTPYEQTRHNGRLLCLKESPLPRRRLPSGRDCSGTQSPLGISSSPPGHRRLPLCSHSAGREVSRRQVRQVIRHVRGFSPPVARPRATLMIVLQPQSNTTTVVL